MVRIRNIASPSTEIIAVVLGAVILYYGGTLVLIDNENICARVVVEMIGESCYLEILNIDKHSIKPNDSKKYQTLKVSLGELQSRKLDIGYRIDITQRSLQNVTVRIEENNYARGCLTNVDGMLAVKIDKVEK